MLDNGFNIGKKLAAVFIQTVKSASLYQLLQLAAVNLLGVNPMDKVGNVFIGSVRVAFSSNSLHIGGAYAFDGGQGIADVAVFNIKVGVRLVNVRRQYLESHFLHSSLYKRSLSTLVISKDITAHINSTG